jgi:hypothetical protein
VRGSVETFGASCPPDGRCDCHARDAMPAAVGNGKAGIFIVLWYRGKSIIPFELRRFSLG